MFYDRNQNRVAKFDLKVGSRSTTQIKNLVVLVIIFDVLILLPYYLGGTSSRTCVFGGKRNLKLKDLLG